MRFGHWLNSLTGIDQLVILACFGISSFLTHVILKNLKQVYEQLQKDNPYSHDFRISPAVFLVTAILITVFVYLILGQPISDWLQSPA